MKVKHAHSSSLYSASPASLKKQVEGAIDDEGPVATLLTFTEVGAQQREDVLKNADPEYNSWQPDVTDVAVMWEKARFKVLYKDAVQLTKLTWNDGHGRKHETWAGSMLLEAKKGGQKLFVSVCHLPSHVQNGEDWYANAQARAWKAACSGWTKHWTAMQKEHHPELGLIVADWNVDFHMPVWRSRVNKYFPSLKLCWTGSMPPKSQGTHGKRLIDATWATAKSQKAMLLKDDASSDHRPYGDVYLLK